MAPFVLPAVVLAVCATLATGATFAEQPTSETQADTKTSSPPARPTRSPYEAVRHGNRLLNRHQPAPALEAYKEAEEQKPDAREIALVKGLAYFDLKEFDKAREAFQEAAGGENDALARDSQYSLGTCDHAEAVEKMTDPKQSLSLLEGAMRKYQSVLADDPDHKAACEANRKAATLWRQIKQQLQQQQQPSSGEDSEQNDQDEKNDQEPASREQPPKDEQQQQEQQKQGESEQQPPQKQEDQQQPSPSAQKDQEQKDQSPQASAEEEKEKVSREQAERKLREMMQAMRDRKKVRREQIQKVPIAPVDKDW